VWHWTAPHGRSSGILLGVNLDVLDVVVLTMEICL
jgi:hypothetical protein